MRWVKILITYFSDWSCRYKRAFWSLLTMDGPLISFDLAWLLAYNEIVKYVGQGIGILAGILGCVLTVYRIMHTRKLLKGE